MQNYVFLSVIGGFTGANPQKNHNINRISDRHFVITPECESASPAYKFRLDVNIINHTDSATEITLEIDWQESIYHHLRGSLYVCQAIDADNWVPCFGQTNANGRYNFVIPIQPGITMVSTAPRYLNCNAASLAKICEKVPELSCRAYDSPELFESVYVFNAAGNKNKKKPLLIVIGRCHPYETAGSFCVDGAIRTLAENATYRQQLLERFDLCLIPLLAVNGVAAGYCQMDGIGSPGMDVSREWSDNNVLCQIIKEAVKGYTVAGYLEFHNWMHPGVDGIKYASHWLTRRYLNQLQTLGAEINLFRRHFRHWIFPSKTYGIMQMLKHTFGAATLALEYPWHNRSCTQMRLLGAKSVLAFSIVI